VVSGWQQRQTEQLIKCVAGVVCVVIAVVVVGVMSLTC